MFIYSVRASSIRLFSVVFLCLIGLLVAVLAGGGVSAASADVTVNYNGIKDEAARRKFIESQGYTLADGCIEEVKFTVPRDFDDVVAGYNEVQKKQGLDLERYHGKTVKRYTYAVTNYKGYKGTVYANLIVYRSRIIACDLSSAAPGGCIEPLVREI